MGAKYVAVDAPRPLCAHARASAVRDCRVLAAHGPVAHALEAYAMVHHHARAAASRPETHP